MNPWPLTELKPHQLKKVQRKSPTLCGKSVEFANLIYDYLTDRPISENDVIRDKLRDEQYNTEPSIQYMRLVALTYDNYEIITDTSGTRVLVRKWLNKNTRWRCRSVAILYFPYQQRLYFAYIAGLGYSSLWGFRILLELKQWRLPFRIALCSYNWLS